MKIILLASGPGSGKSTQGLALTAINKNFIYLSLGETVRQFLKDPEHPISKQYTNSISQGNLLPDEVIQQILATELLKSDYKDKVILLDGYPRTFAQYEDFNKTWGKPAGLIYLDINEEILALRMQSRDSSRSDNNDNAIKQRLKFYQENTKPVLEKIKGELGKDSITIATDGPVHATSIAIYSQLQRIKDIHPLLQKEQVTLQKPISTSIKPVGLSSLFTQWWHTGLEYSSIKAIQAEYQTQNFSFSILNKQVFFLQTPEEIKKVLAGKSHLGNVYRHFSQAAQLKYDFVATDSGDSHSYQNNDQINVWKLIHNAFGQVLKGDRQRIEYLTDKHLNNTFFAKKTFELDTTFDNFFSGFWAEYLFGQAVSLESYQRNRNQLLTIMKQCFYNNYYKILDPIGLTTWIYSHSVNNLLTEGKKTIQTFIKNSSVDSMVKRFEEALLRINEQEKLGLTKEKIAEILNDCVFDLIFEPDFLENVMYEALAFAVKENADLHDPAIREKVYQQGMNKGYLFPIRSRILEEAVTLNNGSILPAGSAVFLDLKTAGLYHSTGARRCVGQTFTHYFKEHFFNQIESVEFKVKEVTDPQERQSGNENVPLSPERLKVSWRLKRDEAMRQMPHHTYKGNQFFDVLSLQENVGLNQKMTKQISLKVEHFVEKNKISWQDLVIVSPEVRGIPIAAQVADRLLLPLFVIRKKGNNKMAEEFVQLQSFDKGYGDKDTVELPNEKIKALAGKKIIFIDDGLASGGSANACIQLLERQLDKECQPAKVVMILAALQHDYIKTTPKLSEHRTVKTLFDCRSKKDLRDMDKINQMAAMKCA
ncbi:Adenylate kinase [Legionella busanensis]|uniref:Adenylate kinase n=1 Tax=Legionella busanensis TaxID=190655 RepID=A0A378JLJ8_9GAMM|nr:nucleoside monophosphate kinase [Legionella busanensis]STX51568.1 Adenylate kinase [Legionella busanensis]